MRILKNGDSIQFRLHRASVMKNGDSIEFRLYRTSVMKNADCIEFRLHRTAISPPMPLKRNSELYPIFHQAT